MQTFDITWRPTRQAASALFVVISAISPCHAFDSNVHGDGPSLWHRRLLPEHPRVHHEQSHVRPILETSISAAEPIRPWNQKTGRPISSSIFFLGLPIPTPSESDSVQVQRQRAERTFQFINWRLPRRVNTTERGRTSVSKFLGSSASVENTRRAFSTSDALDRARLLASSTKPSLKWLQAVPSRHLGLLLDNDSARIAVALRLGNKVCEPHVCICGEMVNSNGYHALSCNITKSKYARHAEINKIVSMAFSSAGFPNRLEPSGLSRRDGKRPDGITSYPWSRGKSLIWDVTVVDTVAASHVNMTSVKCGGAADQAERNKHNNYIDLKGEYVFTPLAFESFGAVGPETSSFLKKLGKLMARRTGEPRSLNFLLQRISIAIQRGNSISVRDTHCDNTFNNCNVFM